MTGARTLAAPIAVPREPARSTFSLTRHDAAVPWAGHPEPRRRAPDAARTADGGRAPDRTSERSPVLRPVPSTPGHAAGRFHAPDVDKHLVALERATAVAPAGARFRPPAPPGSQVTAEGLTERPASTLLPTDIEPAEAGAPAASPTAAGTRAAGLPSPVVTPSRAAGASTRDLPAAPAPSPPSSSRPAGAPAVPGSSSSPLAVTTTAGTELSAAAGTHPRHGDVEAHEAVHRAQVEARGTRPEGTRAQVEAEARRGAQILRHGGTFEPTLAAPAEPLAYDHASAGAWLLDFIEYLREATTYDVEAVDWEQAVEDMMDSDRFAVGDDQTAADLSDKFRYDFLLEVFAQEMDLFGAPEIATDPTPAGLTVPTTAELEDALFRDYLPLLEASDFADSDVRAEGQAFLEHWLTQLETVSLIPEDFDIRSFAPADRSAEIESERELALEEFMENDVPDLMFMFVLDEFARSVQGPNATVQGAPLIAGGGEFRTITAEHWLETLDIEEYRDRLVAHLQKVFDRKLRKDRRFRRLLLTSADEMSRYRSLAAVHLAISTQQDFIDTAPENLRTLPMTELEDSERALFVFPAHAYDRLSAAQVATRKFYRDIRPGLNNDAALITAIDALVDALHRPGEYEAYGALLRVVTLAGAYKTLIEDQIEAAKRRLDELVEVSYDQIAADIQQAATFAATYLRETWIPKLHEVALRRVTANYEVLLERRDNWDVHVAEMIANLRGGATIFTDIADVLEDGTYESVTLEDEVITAEDAYRLRDAAAVMTAEADALEDPEENSERFEKIEEALAGYEDVKGRIERGEVDPNLYGPEVLAEAKAELGIDTFREYTTYADVLFGREVASENPFLARLVVTWKYAEVVDDAVQAILIFSALGLLTIASLLVGSLGAVAAWIVFAIDATISIGIGAYHVSAADALLELVRLDLDQSVTGLTVEQAENALLFAWIMLALSVVLVVGGLALGVALRYGTRAGASLAISLRYFRLAAENPTLFSSLRGIVRDPVRLGRLLDLAGDAVDLQTLLHRMEGTLTLARAERLLELTGDAARVNRMLDLGQDAARLERALVRIERAVPNQATRVGLLDAAVDDAVSLSRLVQRTDDMAQLRRLLDQVPANRLAAIPKPMAEVEAMLARGVRAEDIASGIGAPGGGLAPAGVETRAALPTEVGTLLQRYNLHEVPALQTATSHEAGRLRTVLGSNPLPKKAQPVAEQAAARWAADGVSNPTDFINRWEYLRTRFRSIRGGLDPAAYPNQNLDAVAGRLLVTEIESGTLSAQLTADIGAVRALAGSGWARVSGTSADEIVASVRASANEMSFGTETTTAYHVRKHGFGELPPTERPAAGAGFEPTMAAYVGGARRTLASGTATTQIENGAGSITFVRVVRDASGNRYRMTAQVYVRDGRALISTYGGTQL